MCCPDSRNTSSSAVTTVNRGDRSERRPGWGWRLGFIHYIKQRARKQQAVQQSRRDGTANRGRERARLGCIAEQIRRGLSAGYRGYQCDQRQRRQRASERPAPINQALAATASMT